MAATPSDWPLQGFFALSQQQAQQLDTLYAAHLSVVTNDQAMSLKPQHLRQIYDRLVPVPTPVRQDIDTSLLHIILCQAAYCQPAGLHDHFGNLAYGWQRYIVFGKGKKRALRPWYVGRGVGFLPEDVQPLKPESGVLSIKDLPQFKRALRRPIQPSTRRNITTASHPASATSSVPQQVVNIPATPAPGSGFFGVALPTLHNNMYARSLLAHQPTAAPNTGPLPSTAPPHFLQHQHQSAYVYEPYGLPGKFPGVTLPTSGNIEQTHPPTGLLPYPAQQARSMPPAQPAAGLPPAPSPSTIPQPGQGTSSAQRTSKRKREIPQAPARRPPQAPQPPGPDYKNFRPSMFDVDFDHLPFALRDELKMIRGRLLDEPKALKDGAAHFEVFSSLHELEGLDQTETLQERRDLLNRKIKATVARVELHPEEDKVIVAGIAKAAMLDFKLFCKETDIFDEYESKDVGVFVAWYIERWMYGPEKRKGHFLEDLKRELETNIADHMSECKWDWKYNVNVARVHGTV